MGRKRNQGKARKARATARKEALINAVLQRSQKADSSDDKKAREGAEQRGRCRHGFDLYDDVPEDDISKLFIDAFKESFDDVVESGERSVAQCLVKARDATLVEFADVWNDSAKLEIAMSFFLGLGTLQILDGDCDNAHLRAAYARYFEQHIAVELERTQALYNWPKIIETNLCDRHTLVKFLRQRIPCCCLDEKYQEVKHVPKMGFCYNSQCSIPDNEVERCKTKYCSRCRCITYCSRECQVADWWRHKPNCDKNAAVIAEFEAQDSNSHAIRRVALPSSFTALDTLADARLIKVAKSNT